MFEGDLTKVDNGEIDSVQLLNNTTHNSNILTNQTIKDNLKNEMNKNDND